MALQKAAEGISPSRLNVSSDWIFKYCFDFPMIISVLLSVEILAASALIRYFERLHKVRM